MEKNNKYIESQRKRLFYLALTELPLLKLMLEEVMTLIEKVTEAGNTEATAMLLEYQETKFSEKKERNEMNEINEMNEMNEINEDEEYIMSESQILEEVLFDWFPNAETDEELEYEMDCINWGDD